jgi:hypothetical protein
MKPHESLPVGRACQQLVALQSCVSGRYHAAGRLGKSLQWAANAQSAETRLSLSDPGIHIGVIRCVTGTWQDGGILAGTVEQCRSSKSPMGGPTWLVLRLEGGEHLL